MPSTLASTPAIASIAAIAAPGVFSIFGVFNLFETLAELRFVFQLIVFVYMLYWLFITFNRVPVLFGVSAIVMSYFMLTHSISLMILALAFFFLVLLGNQLQVLVWFGLGPIFNMFGIDLTGQRHMMEEQQKYKQLKGMPPEGMPPEGMPPEQVDYFFEGMKGQVAQDYRLRLIAKR